MIWSGPRIGTGFAVGVDTHVTGTLVHASGVLTTLTTGFDVVASDQPKIEVHGTEGSVRVPDPNTFGGRVRVWRTDDSASLVLPSPAPVRHCALGRGTLRRPTSARCDAGREAI